MDHEKKAPSGTSTRRAPEKKKNRNIKMVADAAANPTLKPPDLAVERNLLAAERTLMAWIRTALSMIGFGFTIYKFLKAVQSRDSASQPFSLGQDSPRAAGLALLGIGVFSLVVACIQHWNYVKRVNPNQQYKPFDLALVVAVLVGLLGLVMIFSIILRTGPLG